jgi:hypothetical protein
MKILKNIFKKILQFILGMVSLVAILVGAIIAVVRVVLFLTVELAWKNGSKYYEWLIARIVKFLKLTYINAPINKID